MSGQTGRTIGIDIGGTSVRAAVVASDGEILTAVRGLTPSTVQRTDDLLVRLIAELRAEYEVDAVGLAVAGFINADRSRVMFAPHLPWRGEAVPELLAQRIGLPVVMDHDVNAAAWAEYVLGAAAGSPVALLVALGTGIGAGLVVDGELYRGAHGVAPELGHLVVVPDGRPCPCGKRGCWERYCSGTALAYTARELWQAGGHTVLEELAAGDPAAITGAMVALAAAEGDTVAMEAVTDLGRWLAAGLAVAVDVLDPEVIVIGGGVSGAAPMFLQGSREALAHLVTGGGHRPLPRVEVARFGDRASVIGAGLLASQLVQTG